MGYTHYWQNAQHTEDQFKSAGNDIKAILGNIQDNNIGIAGYDGTGDPEVNEHLISFNGAGEDSHETFSVGYGNAGFEFCKTQCKPYDIAVMASLLVLKHHGDIKVSSDGEQEDWEPAEKLVKSVLGYEVKSEV